MTDHSKLTYVTRSLLLAAVALALDIALGHLVQYVLQWPVYLDSIGTILTGAGHAPLVYAQDPRADVPAELQQHLAQAIDGSEDRIVAGWLRYGGLE